MTGPSPAFADHFSPSAAAYASYRPRYPAALFEWLASVAPDRVRAWDCATGNGQAATALASYFAHVVATDPSVAQLAHAERMPKLDYAAMTAESAAIAARSVSVVTVAQALHWFDRHAFFAEVRRALVPGGVIAVWSYALGALGDARLDDAVLRFYRETVGPYWPPERAIVEAGYSALEWPFEEIAAPPLAMSATWSLDHLTGYLSSWSAVQRARAATGQDPIAPLLRELAPLWGEPGSLRTIRWPLSVRAGRVL